MRLTETLAAMAFFLVVGVIGGCTWEKLGQRDALTEATAQVAVANGNVEACAATLLAMKDQAAGEIARAEQQTEHAARALETLARENMHMGEALTASEQRMAAAKHEPTCREQLEVELCSVVPLL